MKLFSLSVILSLGLLVFPTVTLAHGSSATQAPALGTTETFTQDQAMHEQMETLMNKMMTGTLTDSEQNEMLDLMREADFSPTGMMGSGMMNESADMMMQGDPFAGPGVLGVMMGTSLLTSILTWIALVLAIVALWKWLKKN